MGASIDCNGSHRAFVNEMFSVPEDLGMKNFFSDLDDPVKCFAVR